MFAQLYFLLYCPSVFGTAGLSGNSHPRPQALRPTRPVHTELRRTNDTLVFGVQPRGSPRNSGARGVGVGGARMRLLQLNIFLYQRIIAFFAHLFSILLRCFFDDEDLNEYML